MNDNRRDDLDPLADLAKAWDGIESPQPADDLADTDPETREAVAWLQGAWNAIEAPAGVAPRVPTATPSLFMRFAPLAAAALVIASLAIALRDDEQETTNTDGATETAASHDTGTEGPPPTNESTESSKVEVSVSPDGEVVMRSGPVRLVMVAPVEIEETPGELR